MSDSTTTTCHPETVAWLKESLPDLLLLAKSASDIPDIGKFVTVASDETRKRFPGLDDLTLAAIHADRAEIMAMLTLEDRNPSFVSPAVTDALVACDLAWEIRETL